MADQRADTTTMPPETRSATAAEPHPPITTTTPPTALRARWLVVGTYLGPALLSIALAIGMLDLAKADLRVPFDYRGDAIVTALLFKSVIENGWYLNIPQVGAPGHLHFHDFPGGDPLHLLAVKGLALFSHDWALVFNVYFLLGFPLITLSALAVFRHFRVALAPATAGAILYAFLPSRLIKGETHMFLDVFYQVPLVLLAALWVCGDDPPLTRDRGPGLWPGLELRRGRSMLAAVFCVGTALGGVYYAFFTGFLLVVGGLWASAERRTLRNAISALMLGGLMVLTLLANALPSLLYIMRHGKNLVVANRVPIEAEIFGLKIIQLLLPVDGHRVLALRKISAEYASRAPLVNENALVSLGVLGSIGFLVLLWQVLLRPRSENPRGDLLRSLAVLNLSAVLLGTVGGFGAIFAWLVTASLRTYCRINVVIAFLALFAFVLLLDRIGRRRPLLTWVLPALLLAIGLLDQVTPAATRPYANTKTEYTADGDFVRDIEGSLPWGAMVYELPFLAFPETTPPEKMMPYDPLRPYVHSHALRWTYPAMAGRTEEIWTSSVAEEPPDKLVDELVAVGFGGIFIDRSGYADHGAALEQALSRALDAAPYVSRGERMAFFNLEPLKAHPHQQLTPAQHEQRRDMALYPLTYRWSAGCYDREPGPQGGFRWCSDECLIELTNASTRVKTAVVSMNVVPGRPSSRIAIDGDLLPHPIVIATDPAPFERTLEIPPGVHTLRFRGEGLPIDAPKDPRRMIFRMDNPILREIAPP
jgi:hypothetical protein